MVVIGAVAGAWLRLLGYLILLFLIVDGLAAYALSPRGYAMLVSPAVGASALLSAILAAVSAAICSRVDRRVREASGLNLRVSGFSALAVLLGAAPATVSALLFYVSTCAHNYLVAAVVCPAVAFSAVIANLVNVIASAHLYFRLPAIIEEARKAGGRREAVM